MPCATESVRSPNCATGARVTGASGPAPRDRLASNAPPGRGVVARWQVLGGRTHGTCHPPGPALPRPVWRPGRGRNSAAWRKDPAVGTAGRPGACAVMRSTQGRRTVWARGARACSLRRRTCYPRACRLPTGRRGRAPDGFRARRAARLGSGTPRAGSRLPGAPAPGSSVARSARGRGQPVAAGYPLAAASFVAFAQSALKSSMPRSVSGWWIICRRTLKGIVAM